MQSCLEAYLKFGHDQFRTHPNRHGLISDLKFVMTTSVHILIHSCLEAYHKFGHDQFRTHPNPEVI